MKRGALRLLTSFVEMFLRYNEISAAFRRSQSLSQCVFVFPCTTMKCDDYLIFVLFAYQKLCLIKSRYPEAVGLRKDIIASCGKLDSIARKLFALKEHSEASEDPEP